MDETSRATAVADFPDAETLPAPPPRRHTPVPAAQPIPEQKPRPSGYLPTLDGWRAIAVGLVIVSHAVHPEDHWVGRLGPFGVSIFFGISGFLICSRLLDERERRGRIDLGGFYVRRCFRILPAAWAYLATAGLFAAVGVLTVDPRQFVGCVLVCRNYFPLETTTGDWYTRHFWSLAVEEHFYFLFPLLLAACGPKRARYLVPALALAVAGWRAVDFRWRWLTDLAPGLYPQFRTDTCMDGLMCGCWVALLVHHYRVIPGIRVMGSFSLAAVAVAVVGVVPVPGIVLALFIPWMLAGTVLRPAGALGRVLESAPLRWVGRLSYSLYLWQELFFVKRPANLAAGLTPLQSWPWNVLGLLACATVSYYLLERPLMRLGHRLATPATPGRT